MDMRNLNYKYYQGQITNLDILDEMKRNLDETLVDEIQYYIRVQVADMIPLFRYRTDGHINEWVFECIRRELNAK